MSLFPRNFAVWGTATGGLTEVEAGAPYRYMLTRERLLPSGPIMMVIGVNPSTATEETNDATIRRCEDFARDSGHATLWMLNLFAYRATDVRELRTAADPVGRMNDHHLLGQANVVHLGPGATRPGTVVCAWGPPSKVPRALRARFAEVPAMLRRHGIPLHVLRLTSGGHPEHPVRLPKALRPVPWSPDV